MTFRHKLIALQVSVRMVAAALILLLAALVFNHLYPASAEQSEKISDIELIEQRINDYFDAHAAGDYAKVWSFFSGRMREEHYPKAHYLEKASSMRPMKGGIRKVGPTKLTIKAEGSGKEVKIDVIAETPVQPYVNGKPYQTEFSPVIYVTRWTKEQPESGGLNQLMIYAEDMKPMPK